MNEWMNEWMNERMNEWKNPPILFSVSVFSQVLEIMQELEISS